MRICVTLLAALALAGCETLPPIGGTLPAPLEKTTIDDSALLTAWQAHSALQDALNLYMDAKPSFAGSAAAKRVADYNDAVTAALSAAEAAAAAGSATDYFTALANAKQALGLLRTALAAAKGQ